MKSRDERIRKLKAVWMELTEDEKRLVLLYREALIEARKGEAV